MDSKSMTRKDFFVLTFSLVGSAVVASNCSSSNGGGGTGGKTGSGGATGTGGRGTGGSTGTGGAGSGGATGTGGRGTGGSTDGGPGDVPVTPDSGGDTATNCTLPLPEQQQVVVTGTGGDTNSHFHSVMVGAAVLNATTAQTITTSMAGQGNGHTHDVTFSPTELATLRAGLTVTVRSTNFGASDAGTDGLVAGHTHSYLVSCHPIPDGGADTGPSDATAG
jgi:hypothetical protein